MERKLLTYSKTERNTFYLALIGQNIFYSIISSAFAYFLQFTVLIPAAAVGTLMAGARAFDACNDPLMGVIVDRTNTKYGKCRPYLMVTPVLCLITTILCFWAPFGVYTQSNSTGMVIAWAAFTYLLWGVAYTIGDIPLWGITALITENDEHRNKILATGRILCGIGFAVGFVVQPLALLLSGSVGGELNAFFLIAVACSILGAILFQFFGFAAREKIKPTEKPAKISENLKIMWSNKPFRQILISGILGSPKALIMIALFPLFSYYFAAKDFGSVIMYLALIGAGLFAGQYVAIAMTPKFLKHISKRKLYNYSNLIAVIPCIVVFLLYLSDPMGLTKWYYVISLAVCFAFAGFGAGVPMVMQSVMIADCVDYQEYQTGLRPDGVSFSGQSFIAKMQAAIATFISGLAYAYVGFSDTAIERVNAFIEAGGIPRLEPEFQSYMMILFFLVSVPVAVGHFLSVIPTWKYALDTDEHKKILEELNQRRHERDEAGAGETG